MSARRQPTTAAPGAAELIEEAVHLLRSHPGELGVYYLGTAGFAVAFLYFWAFVTWFMPDDGALAAGAAGLVVLYAFLLAAQHRFALRLRARLEGETPPRWTARRWRTEMAAQLRLHAASLIVLPLAAVFTVTFGWAFAYFQSAVVTPAQDPADTAARRVAAWEFARLWPAQNHWALAIFAGLWAMTFFNVAVAFYAVPTLVSRWLGLETIFALQGWSYLNSTFLALVAVLTQLLVGPLMRAFYVLRVFRGAAQTTGADLRLALRREQANRSGARSGLTALLLACAALAFAADSRAAATDGSAGRTAQPVVSAAELDARLDRVLEQREYRWRLRPLPAPPERGKEGLVQGAVRATFEMVREVLVTLGEWYRRAESWVRDWFPGSRNREPVTASPRDGAVSSIDWMHTLQLVAYGLLVVIAGLLLFVAWKVWRHRREFAIEGGAGAKMPVPTPDLRDESVEASRLPAHEWLELARRQLAAGEWRLALRALFLATLATHAHAGFVSLAKFKTNLDYERELRRRAHGRSDLVEEFRASRRQFESVWYGAEPAREETALEWLRRLEGRP